MIIAAEIGLKPSEFWELTPAELFAFSTGFKERERENYRRTIYGAYLTARLGRVKDFPELSDLLAPIDGDHQQTPKCEQSAEEMFEIIKNFDADMRRGRLG